MCCQHCIDVPCVWRLVKITRRSNSRTNEMLQFPLFPFKMCVTEFYWVLRSTMFYPEHVRPAAVILCQNFDAFDSTKLVALTSAASACGPPWNQLHCNIRGAKQDRTHAWLWYYGSAQCLVPVDSHGTGDMGLHTVGGRNHYSLQGNLASTTCVSSV